MLLVILSIEAISTFIILGQVFSFQHCKIQKDCKNSLFTDVPQITASYWCLKNVPHTGDCAISFSPSCRGRCCSVLCFIGRNFNQLQNTQKRKRINRRMANGKFSFHVQRKQITVTSNGIFSFLNCSLISRLDK